MSEQPTEQQMPVDPDTQEEYVWVYWSDTSWTQFNCLKTHLCRGHSNVFPQEN